MLKQRKLRAAAALGMLAAMAVVAGCGEDAAEPNAGGTQEMPMDNSAEPMNPGTDTMAEMPMEGPAEPMDLEETLMLIEERVREIRGIEHSGESSYRLVSAEELEETVRATFDDVDEDEAEDSEFIFRQLGILEPEDDLLEMAEDLLGSQVIGLYEPETQEILVRQDSGDVLDVFTASTYAHEYVHFLQDAQFGLDEYIDVPEDGEESSLTSDELAARTAVAEGDATLTTVLYLQLHGNEHPVPEMEPDFEGAFEDFNAFLLNDLNFPYVQGAAFVQNLWLEDQAFDLIDEAYSNPPRSTEEILHVDSYLLARDEQADLSEFRATPLGDWSVKDSDVLGEFFISNWLDFLGASSLRSRRGAAGWGGDEFSLLESPDGGLALQWVIAWDDSETDAAEFTAALSEGLEESSMFTPSECLDGEAWDSGAGVLAHATTRSDDHGVVSVVAAAPECGQLEALLP